jgi:hypothetical protein
METPITQNQKIKQNFINIQYSLYQRLQILFFFFFKKTKKKVIKNLQDLKPKVQIIFETWDQLWALLACCVAPSYYYY